MRNHATLTLRFFAVPALAVMLAGGLAGSLAGCSAFEGRESAGQYANDTSITTAVKTNILADKNLSVFQINVETMKGVVQLSGFVDSVEHKADAERIARNVKGVKEVENDLVVR